MNNIDGALAFKATLDIDDFNVSAQAMERNIRNVASSTTAQAAEMEQSLLSFAQNSAHYIVSYLVGQGMNSLLQSIIATRGQFQQLEIAFGTMLGSTSKAKALMDQMTETAAKTPFDLQGVAGGAKQLLAYGESAEKVNDTLVRLGNIASGLSIPLNDIVYLYGTTMVQGRLYAQDVRQFTGRGIPLVKELAEAYGVTTNEINAMVSAGKIGFEDVEKVILKLTDSGGQFYNLMEKQSASLTGQISNLEDAWDMLLNKVGTEFQGEFSSGISAVSNSVDYLTENLEGVLRIVKAVTVAYGSYRAALVLNTLATKGYTGVALLDNTARQAKIALLRLDAVVTGQAAAQTAAMTAAQEAHVASLQKQLTAEQLLNLQKQLRIATIQSLLTAQQQEYLSNLNITTASAEYESVAMGVLTVDQRVALSKTDLSAKSAVYRAALEQEVAAQIQNQAAKVASMRADVSAAAAKVETAKATAVASMQATEAARYEVYWAKQSGDAVRIATAEKKLEGAQENQSVARKAALAAQTDFYTKKKALEAATTRTATAASATDTAAKGAQTAATSLLSAVTAKATLAMKALWASMLSNPIGWIVGAIGALVSLVALFGSSEEEATDAMGEFNKSTQDEINRLDTLMAILATTESGTKSHKDALDKVNQMCQEYNKTLLDENATLDKQKEKYQELTTAIRATTAEKIKAKYVEQEMQSYNDNSDDNFKSFGKSVKRAAYFKKPEEMTSEYDMTEASEHIRQMGDEVKEAIRSMIEESASKLSGLTGDAFTQEYDKVVNQILESTKAATGATDREIEGFSGDIKSYLNDQIESYNDMQTAVNRVDNSLQQFYSKQDPTPVVESALTVESSFEELEKKAQDTQAEIDAINAKTVRVDTDNTRLLELQGILNNINGLIGQKQTNLNTEAGISDRIKQLTEERKNVEINSARYNELNSQITELQNKLPKHTTGGGKSGGGGGRNNAQQNAESLQQKQLEADRKLEEARISIMEEGYEKRKAQLDLQHKENLDRIDKEEKELADARKKAGKGGLSKEEKENFTERRSIENKSYEKAQTTLFDGEIDYKKKQYELYFRWVRNMGKDVADAQFASLLQDGASYKEYIEKQIEQLKDKQRTGTLSEGEGNQLITLNMQYDEITGAKSAMDQFKESVTATISQASNLAEKLEAVAKARESLDNGSSGLVGGDEQAAGSLFLSEEEEKLQKEVQEKVLANYRTYEEQKKSIQDEYALLRSEAQKMNDEERLNQINKAENEALSALNASFLMQSDAWKNLFSDLDSLTVSEIDKLIKEIQDKMNTADLKLNPSDLKAVLDKLDEAKKKVLDTNPFKAMGSALSAVFTKTKDGSKKSSKQIKTDWSNLANATEGCFDFINNAVDSCSVLGDLLGDTGKATMDMLQGMATAGIAMASAIKTAEKGSIILAAISIALQAIQWIATLFNNDDKIEERIQGIQKEVDALSNSFDRLKHASEKTYWQFTDEEKSAHQKRLQAIQDQIDALKMQATVARQSWKLVEYSQLVKQIKELTYALEKAQNQGDMFDLYELEKKNLKQQQELIKRQIEEEKSKKKTDWDKIAQWEETIKDIDTQIEDLERDMIESLAGTDVKSAIDEFADALVDAYCKGEDAAKALGDKTKEVLKNAVVEALKRQFLAKAINDAVLYLGSAFQNDGILDDNEKAEFERRVKEAGDTFNKALEAVGDWIKDETEEDEEDALAGAVKSMSEDTAGIIAGRLNAVIINQGLQLAIVRDQLAYQAEIAANTKVSAERLGNIESTLRRIENNDSSLLSQGIS